MAQLKNDPSIVSADLIGLCTQTGEEVGIAEKPDTGYAICRYPNPATWLSKTGAWVSAPLPQDLFDSARSAICLAKLSEQVTLLGAAEAAYQDELTHCPQDLLAPIPATRLVQLHATDCLRAALACILGLAQPDAVPDFSRGDIAIEYNEFWDAFHSYLARIGLKATVLRADPCLPQAYLAHGRSIRGHQHAVVWRNGVLEHDPHPDGNDGQPFIPSAFHILSESPCL